MTIEKLKSGKWLARYNTGRRTVTVIAHRTFVGMIWGYMGGGHRRTIERLAGYHP